LLYAAWPEWEYAWSRFKLGASLDDDLPGGSPFAPLAVSSITLRLRSIDAHIEKLFGPFKQPALAAVLLLYVCAGQCALNIK